MWGPGGVQHFLFLTDFEMKKKRPNFERDLRKLKKKFIDYKYAQRMYAALCNNVWVHTSKPKNYQEIQEKGWISPVYKSRPAWEFSTSWRGAGAMVAQIRKGEDYMDYYCSGIINHDAVDESKICEEIEIDLNKMGWEHDKDYDERLEVVYEHRDLNRLEY